MQSLCSLQETVRVSNLTQRSGSELEKGEKGLSLDAGLGR